MNRMSSILARSAIRKSIRGIGSVGGLSLHRAFASHGQGSDRKKNIGGDQKVYKFTMEGDARMSMDEAFDYKKSRKVLQNEVFDIRAETLTNKVTKKLIERRITKHDTDLVIQDLKKFIATEESIEKNKAKFSVVLCNVLKISQTRTQQQQTTYAEYEKDLEFVVDAIKKFHDLGVSFL